MKYEKLNERNFNLVAKFCRINLPFDQIPVFLFKEKTIDDPDFDKDLTLIAIENDEIIGFIMGVVRNHSIGKYGYIKFLCIKYEYRRKGIGTEIYNKIFSEFVKVNCQRVRVCESHPNYLTPGIDPRYTEAICFFDRKGFVKFNDTCNLICDLNANDFSTDAEELLLKNKGFSINRATLEDKSSVIEFLQSSYPLWIHEVSNTFENNPITLHLSLFNNKIVGFAGHNGNNFDTGWFGPMATDSDYRGKNIGAILLKRCLNDLKLSGFSFSTIPWVGPISFYMNTCNAKVDRVFWRYEKIL